MTKQFVEVTVSSLGVNDENATITDFVKKDGDYVNKGDELVSLETTKSSFDVEACSEGYVLQLFEIGDEIKVGQTISLIVKDKSDKQKIKDEYLKGVKKYKETDDFKITKKAKFKADKNNISLEDLKNNFSGIVREKDIDFLLNKDEVNKNITKRMPQEIVNIPVVKNIMIYGVVTSGASLVDIEIIHSNPNYRVSCFVDDDSSKHGKLFGLPVLSWKEFTENKVKLEIHHFFVSIGNGVARSKKMSICKKKGLLPINLVHLSADVSKSASLGDNLLIKRGAIVGPNALIGDGVFIDNGAIVSHDCKLGMFTHVAPGASLGGNIEVGNFSIIGVGASVASDLTLGNGTIITTGTAVVNNHDELNVVQGNPGHRIGKSNITLP